MKVWIDGKVIDSTKVPVLIQFDENEQKMFNGLKKFVSAPDNSTEEERRKLIDKDLFTCEHKRTESWNHGHHNRCLDCGEKDVY